MIEGLSVKLRQARFELGQTKGRRVTIEEVGLHTGLTAAAISAYETGIRTPNAESLKKLCRYYNLSADYLLGI